MKMVNIRSVRGAELKRAAQVGELVGLMRNRNLIGVVVPVTPNWVAHVIENNWSRIVQSVTEGEQAMAGGAPMVTVEQVLATGPAGGGAGRLADQAASRFLAAVGAVPSEDSDLPPARTVRVGDLSAAVVERAGAADEVLAVTHDGLLLGIVVPVNQRLIRYLIDKNKSRVSYNVHYGEKEILTDEPLQAIGRVLSEHPDLFAPDPSSRQP